MHACVCRTGHLVCIRWPSVSASATVAAASATVAVASPSVCWARLLSLARQALRIGPDWSSLWQRRARIPSKFLAARSHENVSSIGACPPTPRAPPAGARGAVACRHLGHNTIGARATGGRRSTRCRWTYRSRAGRIDNRARINVMNSYSPSTMRAVLVSSRRHHANTRSSGIPERCLVCVASGRKAHCNRTRAMTKLGGFHDGDFCGCSPPLSGAEAGVGGAYLARGSVPTVVRLEKFGALKLCELCPVKGTLFSILLC